MTKETIKNRNRIVHILDNCANLLSTKKDIDANTQKVAFRVKQLANLLRDTTECENTIERLNKVYIDIINNLKRLNNPLIGDNASLLRLQDIVEMGLKSYNDEKLDSAVSAYSLGSLRERIKEKENELENLKQSMAVMVADGAENSKEYANQKRKSVILNSNIAKLKVMAEAREKRDDREKVLSEKTSSIVTGLDDAIKDLKDEKKRLENLTCWRN